MLTSNLVFDKSLTMIGPGVSPGVTRSSGKHDYEILIDPRISVSIEGLAFKDRVLMRNDFIRSSGNLVLDNTLISGNNITGSHTGLIYNSGGQVTILNSIITNNIGEIYNSGGPMTITNSIISDMNCNNPNKTIDNTSPPIYNETDGSLTIRDSTIADNISYFNGGGIYNGGQLTISGSTISGNSKPSVPDYPFNNGGGIANDEGGTLTITNSTIAGNTAGESGGGIANLSGKTLLSFCTIFGNSARVGGGVVVLAGSVTLSKSIVAGNTLVAGEQPFHPLIAGTLISQGFNLMQNITNIVPQHKSAPDTSNIAVSRFTPVHDRTVSAGDLTKIFDPQGLQNNGGQTKTYKLLAGPDDPAIDAIPLADCYIPDILDKATHKYIDQRGAARPDDNEQFCDIGAYESSD